MITTTLNKIRRNSPCEDGWAKLLKHLGKTKGDDEAITFSTIIESNGLDDALWCLKTICPEHDKEVRLFAADCAESVLHIYEGAYPDDDRPRKAIEAARTLANSEIDDATWDAAWAAARDAARAAAWDATWDAARAAAWAAAWAAQIQMVKDRFS